MPRSEYDYIIVGAGPAGCVLANRLSEDPANRVLLLEAGGSDQSTVVQMPAAVPFAYMSKRLGWGYESGPEPHLNGRMIDEKRGRVLGGTSSINAMIFNRGNPLDYDGWAQSGLAGWGWAQCLPFFKKMEDFPSGDAAWRGRGGPLRISRCKADHLLFECFLRAGEQAGHRRSEDHNGAIQEGLHVAQACIHEGRRWNATAAYLRPVRGRTNLTVQVGRFVERICFDGHRATGVVVRRPKGASELQVSREVIVSAGAFASPQLLMLSGVGDADELRRHGIREVLHLPGVGKGLENHPGVNIQYATNVEHSIVSELGPLGRLGIGMNWLLRKQGLGTTNFFETGAFLRTRPDFTYPNMQFEFLPLVRFVKDGKLHARPGFQFWMDLSRPLSRGSVTLRSGDPAAPPVIVFNHLAQAQDRRDLIDGIRLARELIRQPAWDSIRQEELAPGSHVQTDAELDQWLAGNVGSSYHPSGTCRMGTDELAVVDASARVRGLDGLRVIDASIMPTSVTANLSAAIYMMAEKLADAIRSPTAPAQARAGAEMH
jgi:choline dehydrogenase